MPTKTFVDPDVGRGPAQLYAERTKRFADVYQLKQPDRVPIQLGFGYMLAEMYGATRQEQHESAARELEMLEKAGSYFQPDSIMGLFNNPAVSLAVGDRMTKFPGHGLDPNGSFQFVEGEYMKAEDYDAFIDDPADWGIRKYWPRVFSELGGIGLLPPLGMATFGVYGLYTLGSLAAPPLAKALRVMAHAVEAQAAADQRAVQTVQRMAELGFGPPTFMGALIEAPFDLMSDTLRGMRGIMLDMHRHPDKLLAAQEKVLRFQLEYAINWCNATGIKVAFIPLHRGSDGFMSLAQFEKFYWPQLRAMQVGLVEAGIMPFVFYEGVWDQRLTYLTELPKGKTTGLFQSSDIFKVKRVVGDTMCIMGGMPNSLLQAGTAQQVRDLTKRLCQEVGKGGGYIMSVGVGEMEGCRPDLVKVWVDATKEYGVYN
ncbi:MAG TPA: uroporphyrinogen decarboxylase family protein [Spirochaetia bacterium]|nr:uroporphyrinogen decarboxylase family protein [Spirochaetia bacterium]